MAERVREEGLERWDMALHLTFNDDLVPHLAWNPVPPETAHVWLLGSQYEQVSRYLDPVTWAILGGALLLYLYRVVRLKRASGEQARG